jgi:hypothetical protein
MNTYFSKIFRIRPGREQVFFDWMEEVNRRREEAISTFEHEGIHREVFATFKSEEGVYVVGFNEALVVPKKSDQAVELNRKHVEVMRECLEPISERGTIMFDFSRGIE